MNSDFSPRQEQSWHGGTAFQRMSLELEHSSTLEHSSAHRREPLGIVELDALESLESAAAPPEPSVRLESRWIRFVGCTEYLEKLRGAAEGPPQSTGQRTSLFSAVCAFLSIGSLALINYLHDLAVEDEDGDAYTAVLGSFGASAVLMFGVPMSQLAQPRNAIFGQLTAAVLSIAIKLYVARPMGTPLLALPLAIALSLYAMQRTRTVHPPVGLALFPTLPDRAARLSLRVAPDALSPSLSRCSLIAALVHLSGRRHLSDHDLGQRPAGVGSSRPSSVRFVRDAILGSCTE